jgi:hypothetical protein
MAHGLPYPFTTATPETGVFRTIAPREFERKATESEVENASFRRSFRSRRAQIRHGQGADPRVCCPDEAGRGCFGGITSEARAVGREVEKAAPAPDGIGRDEWPRSRGGVRSRDVASASRAEKARESAAPVEPLNKKTRA